MAYPRPSGARRHVLGSMTPRSASASRTRKGNLLKPQCERSVGEADGMKEEGVPGTKGGLAKNQELSLSKRRPLSKLVCRRTDPSGVMRCALFVQCRTRTDSHWRPRRGRGLFLLAAHPWLPHQVDECCRRAFDPSCLFEFLRFLVRSDHALMRKGSGSGNPPTSVA